MQVVPEEKSWYRQSLVQNFPAIHPIDISVWTFMQSSCSVKPPQWNGLIWPLNMHLNWLNWTGCNSFEYLEYKVVDQISNELWTDGSVLMSALVSQTVMSRSSFETTYGRELHDTHSTEIFLCNYLSRVCILNQCVNQTVLLKLATFWPWGKQLLLCFVIRLLDSHEKEHLSSGNGWQSIEHAFETKDPF